MANGEKVKNGNGRFSYRQTVVLAIVSAVLSGSGVPYFLNALNINPYRVDAFTGSEGKLMDARITALESNYESHAGPNHPDIRNQFDRRITVVETNQLTIMSSLQRIEMMLMDRFEN